MAFSLVAINGRLLRIPYRFTTPYVDAPMKEQNKLWADMFPRKRFPIFACIHRTLSNSDNLCIAGLGAIKVEHEWAAKHHLPVPQGNASDGLAIYTVAAFHQLHCLVSLYLPWISEGKADKGSKTVIRTSIYQYHSGRDQLDPWTHITHCLDTLRQEIQCSADPTIGGMSRVHECRDIEALKEWTTKHAYTEFLAELP